MSSSSAKLTHPKLPSSTFFFENLSKIDEVEACTLLDNIKHLLELMHDCLIPIAGVTTDSNGEERLTCDYTNIYHQAVSIPGYPPSLKENIRLLILFPTLLESFLLNLKTTYNIHRDDSVEFTRRTNLIPDDLILPGNYIHHFKIRGETFLTTASKVLQELPIHLNKYLKLMDFDSHLQKDDRNIIEYNSTNSNHRILSLKGMSFMQLHHGFALQLYPEATIMEEKMNIGK